MAGILHWDLGDGSIIDSNNFSHNYTTPGNKTVQIYKGTATGPGDITQIRMNSDNLVGTLDLSSLSNLSYLYVPTNRKLSKIIVPNINSATWTGFAVNDCTLNGVLDVSNLSGLAGDFFAYGNKNLTNILNPSTGGVISNYWVGDCDLTGTLDCSSLSKLGGWIIIYGNRKLKSIKNPKSSQSCSTYWVFDNSLSGTLDCSGFSSMSGSFYCYGNKELTNFLLPPGNLTFSSGFRIENCNISGVLDLSSYTIGQAFYANGNSGLTNIVHRASTTKVSYQAYDCSLKILDVSCLNGIYNTFDIHGNDTLTKLVLPNTLNHRDLYIVDVSGCNLETESIDAIYLKLANLWDASIPSGGTNINTSSWNNSPPTDSSMNTNVQKIFKIFDSSTTQNLTLILNDGKTDMLKFDGSVCLYNPTAKPAGDYTMEFNCFIDATLANWSTSNIAYIMHDNLGVKFDNAGKILYFCNGSAVRYECPMITPKIKNNIKLMFNSALTDVSLYINGVVQSKTASTLTAAGGTGLFIGGWSSTDDSNIKGFAMWDLSINGQHLYYGTPDGSTEAGWADQIGSWDLSILHHSNYTPKNRYVVYGKIILQA